MHEKYLSSLASKHREVETERALEAFTSVYWLFSSNLTPGLVRGLDYEAVYLLKIDFRIHITFVIYKKSQTTLVL